MKRKTSLTRYKFNLSFFVAKIAQSLREKKQKLTCIYFNFMPK